MTNIANQVLVDRLAQQGYGIYSVKSGRRVKAARFAIADPYDDADGFYLEAHHLNDLLEDAALCVFDRITDMVPE